MRGIPRVSTTVSNRHISSSSAFFRKTTLGKLLKMHKVWELKVCCRQLVLTLCVSKYSPVLLKAEQRLDTKELFVTPLFSVVDCCLYVCKNFTAYVAHTIYNYILYRNAVLKSVGIQTFCTYPVNCAVLWNKYTYLYHAVLSRDKRVFLRHVACTYTHLMAFGGNRSVLTGKTSSLLKKKNVVTWNTEL